MSIVAKDEGKKFHLPPAELLQAVCFDCWDLGRQKVEYKGETKIKPRVMIGWELNARITSDDEFSGKRYRVYKKYTRSLNEKADLNKDLTSWRGRPFTEAEKKVDGFDIEKVVGANCFLNIVHAEANGKTYANISSVNAMPKNTPMIQAETPRGIPDWVAKIQAKAEIVGTMSESEEPETDGDEIPF